MATYSDRQKADALTVLELNEGNISKTSRQLGIPRSTLQSWANDLHISEDVPEIRQESKRAISDMLEEYLRKLVTVAIDKVDEASVRDLNGGIKIATEMMQLLEGNPTSIEKRIDELTPDERRNRVSELLNTARARGTTSSVGDGEVYQ